ncbi:uncharacterized protein LOC131663832 isoform X2 [Phymastichus coffea]|uniref:uncharacterized protein LOC131663832 isoform X2 n=1 Tax=Phymastichus coffea TaxID=108790 RepID=UPI00273AC7A4|nr:uncharacterized protein LOC131663832 isoform X2 [Phymastichus coffea]
MEVSVKQLSILLLMIAMYSKSCSTSNYRNSNLFKNKIMKSHDEFDVKTVLQQFNTFNISHMIEGENNTGIIRNYKNEYSTEQFRLNDKRKLNDHHKQRWVELKNLKIHNKYTGQHTRDETFQIYSLERSKRDIYNNYKINQHSSYGSGNPGFGDFISSLTGQIAGSFVDLSSSAFKKSSNSMNHHQPVILYNPSIQNELYRKEFSFWDFKRAVISTLIQVIKAIGGSITALKGQLIKGSGFVVSSTGRIISSTGNVITDLGTKLARSAIVQPPLSIDSIYQHFPHTYQLSNILTQTDNIYSGPPPSSGSYYSTFGSPTDLVYSHAYHQ